MAQLAPNSFDCNEVDRWEKVLVLYENRDANRAAMYAWICDQPGYYECSQHAIREDCLWIRFSEPLVAFEFKMRFV